MGGIGRYREEEGNYVPFLGLTVAGEACAPGTGRGFGDR